MRGDLYIIAFATRIETFRAKSMTQICALLKISGCIELCCSTIVLLSHPSRAGTEKKSPGQGLSGQ
jgi:hypothetical protein